MEVLNAVDLAGGIHRERDAIEATMAHHTSEAARVIGLPHSPQDPVQDRLRTCGALLQGGLLGRRSERSGLGRPTAALQASCHPTHLFMEPPAYDLVKGGLVQI